MPIDLKCEEVRLEVSNYVDKKVATALRQQMENHFKTCRECKSLLGGMVNVVELLGAEKSFELPPYVSRRLYKKLDQYLTDQAAGLPEAIPVGITNDSVPLGSHLIYFWDSDSEFERGVRFLYPGLEENDHCIAFGHDEALEKVCEVLRSKGHDPDQLIKKGRLSLLRRHASAQATLADISLVMESAMRTGVKAVRFLGNLGMGRDPLPAGEDDVLELETKATALISKFPGVIVCMYDVKTLSGRLIKRGGLETHHLSVCSEGVHENPYYVPGHDHDSVRHIH